MISIGTLTGETYELEWKPAEYKQHYDLNVRDLQHFMAATHFQVPVLRASFVTVRPVDEDYHKAVQKLGIWHALGDLATPPTEWFAVMTAGTQTIRCQQRHARDHDLYLHNHPYGSPVDPSDPLGIAEHRTLFSLLRDTSRADDADAVADRYHLIDVKFQTADSSASTVSVLFSILCYVGPDGSTFEFASGEHLCWDYDCSDRFPVYEIESWTENRRYPVVWYSSVYECLLQSVANHGEHVATCQDNPRDYYETLAGLCEDGEAVIEIEQRVRMACILGQLGTQQRNFSDRLAAHQERHAFFLRDNDGDAYYPDTYSDDGHSDDDA